ncbi:hypothetical protein VTL71DRAFT_15523 [Oculimacula yallundae]|uniref:SMODS and SLOG-associating 2TM effector domain-containing protein n=1 Tax=Oculimacula yallundae TaxID=86028 RepID=A0ABR4CGV5_9HELO
MNLDRVRAYYKRFSTAVRYAPHRTWIELQNLHTCPYYSISALWGCVGFYIGLTRRDPIDLNFVFWLLVGYAHFVDSTFKANRLERIQTLGALRELPSEERDTKIEEMWLQCKWTSRRLERDQQDLDETAEEKQPMLVEVNQGLTMVGSSSPLFMAIETQSDCTYYLANSTQCHAPVALGVSYEQKSAKHDQ